VRGKEYPKNTTKATSEQYLIKHTQMSSPLPLLQSHLILPQDQNIRRMGNRLIAPRSRQVVQVQQEGRRATQRTPGMSLGAGEERYTNVEIGWL